MKEELNTLKNKQDDLFDLKYQIEVLQEENELANDYLNELIEYKIVATDLKKNQKIYDKMKRRYQKCNMEK